MPENAKGALRVIVNILWWIVIGAAALAAIGYFLECFGINTMEILKGS